MFFAVKPSLTCINPFSLMLNIINIYWIYLSIESLEDQLAQSEVLRSCQLAFSNPNLQTMVQYYVSNKAITYGKEFMQQTISVYSEVGQAFEPNANHMTVLNIQITQEEKLDEEMGKFMHNSNFTSDRLDALIKERDIFFIEKQNDAMAA